MEHKFGILHRIKSFLRRERGAVTVDWVVLTAFVVGSVWGVSWAVKANIPGLADNISTTLASM